VSKLIGIGQSKLKPRMVRRIALMLSALFALNLLTACGSIRGTATGGKSGTGQRAEKAKAARCAGLKHLSFSVEGATPDEHGDTHDTINEIREHNATLDNRGCNDKPPGAQP